MAPVVAREDIRWLDPDDLDFNVALVRRLVAAQFPAWADLPVQPVEVDGWDNRTFRLGAEMSVRLPSHKAYAAQVEKEQRWLPRLAPLLPLPIPAPLAMGVPGEGFVWHWSVYRWLDGDPASIGTIEDATEFATNLAGFLGALQGLDSTGGPEPGLHNFFRGGSLQVYDGQTRDAISKLDGRVDVRACATVWEAALAAAWRSAPVWVHGDVAASNLLVSEGCLRAVIDFGCSCVGDPACDMVIAWTFFSEESREAFCRGLSLDDATWARGRGWALWKALITLADPKTGATDSEEARRVIDEVLTDHAAVR